jgi:hypothetical protein
MTTTLTLDTETHAALVRIIQRAAQRGRAIREAQQTANLDTVGSQDQAGGTSAPLGQNAQGVYHDETK